LRKDAEDMCHRPLRTSMRFLIKRFSVRVTLFVEYAEALLGKVILFKCLKKFTSGRELFQVIEDQGFELIIESHLQRAVEKAFQPFIIKVGRQVPGQPGGGSQVKGVGNCGLANTATDGNGFPGLSA
jgi:hypothetical protein